MMTWRKTGTSSHYKIRTNTKEAFLIPPCSWSWIGAKKNWGHHWVQQYQPQLYLLRVRMDRSFRKRNVHGSRKQRRQRFFLYWKTLCSAPRLLIFRDRRVALQMINFTWIKRHFYGTPLTVVYRVLPSDSVERSLWIEQPLTHWDSQCVRDSLRQFERYLFQDEGKWRVTVSLIQWSGTVYTGTSQRGGA